jgi:hypothetical protein
MSDALAARSSVFRRKCSTKRPGTHEGNGVPGLLSGAKVVAALALVERV